MLIGHASWEFFNVLLKPLYSVLIDTVNINLSRAAPAASHCTDTCMFKHELIFCIYRGTSPACHSYPSLLTPFPLYLRHWSITAQLSPTKRFPDIYNSYTLINCITMITTKERLCLWNPALYLIHLLFPLSSTIIDVPLKQSSYCSNYTHHTMPEIRIQK